jgi:subtilisin-like proprotein convertase family protein
MFLSITCLQTVSFTQSQHIPVIDSIITRITIDSIKKVVRELSGDTTCMIGGNTYLIQTRAYNYPGNELAAQYIYERFQSYGLQASYWQFSSTGKNVIAQKTGVKYPNKKYIIGAHYDSYPFASFAPGADDDASGIAVVLEAAKQLSRYNFDYTLLFIGWDEEERGLYGSHAYTDSAYVHGDSIMGYINLDMVGYDPQNRRNVAIYTNTNSLPLAQFMYSVIYTYFPDMNPQTFYSSSGGSDQSSFWSHGYKAIWPFENPSNPSVNSVADSIEWFNFKYFTEMTQNAVACFASLAFKFDLTFEHDPLPSDTTTMDRIAKVIIKCGQVLASGSNSPKLYYKIGSSFYNSVDYYYKNTDTFKFIIPGQPQGSVVSYYFAAQDSAGILSSTYPPGGSGINPPGTTPPNNPIQYIILKTQTVCSSTLPRSILPLQYTIDSIIIQDDRIVSDLNVNLTINFLIDSVLYISLVSPQGSPMLLSAHNGGAGANYINTTFDDSATVSIKNGQAPFTGVFRPEHDLGFVCNEKPFAGVWKLRVFNLSQSLTGEIVSWCLNAFLHDPIGITNNQVPVKISLSQNYPNPFNPTTTIRISLERQSEVKLIVYDVLGREMKVVINNKMNGGDYNIKFDGSGLSSGIYFYTMYLNGSRYETKKMMLIK